jgi:DNA-binding NarL/FixJ family response regulator
MRVALADDSALFRRGLAALLATAGIEVCVETRDARDLQARIAVDPPDVVILDIRMPPTFTDEGLQAAERIHASSDIGVLMLSTYAQTDYATRLLSIGSSGTGYLLKDRVDNIETLVSALARIRNGESVVDPDIVSRLFARRRRSSVLDELTTRERTVLRLMAEGRSNVGIGKEMFLSPKTVESHAAGVFVKLGLAAENTNNRRVLAVLRWLRANDEDIGSSIPLQP